MVKCQKCDGRGYFPLSNIAVKICDCCNGTGEIQQTEQEYIQTCNTEQLAEMLANESKNVINDFKNFDFKREHKEFWEMWLKQPHTNEVAK